MANALYDNARNLFARGDLQWKNGGNTFRAFLVDSATYTPDLAAHDFLDDVPTSARKGGAGGATGFGDGVVVVPADPAAGVCDAADITFVAVGAGTFEYILIYRALTSDALSPLVALIDTATGLPITANGGDITVTWDNGANRIFKL